MIDNDADLQELDHQQLRAEVKRLREAIRKHRDSSGHDLCWYHPELWSLLPEKYDPKPTIPEFGEFIHRCVAYRTGLEKPFMSAMTEINAMLAASLGRCCLCEVSSAIVGFIVPLDEGGDASAENMIPVCRACNAEIHLKQSDLKRGIAYTAGELRTRKSNFLAEMKKLSCQA